jgi:hypothetical protein
MFVHCVYFWLKPDVTEAERQQFIRGVQSLTTAGTVRHGWVGKPADTFRPVIERTYSHAAVLVFDDKAGHDAYQVDPIHSAFLDGLKHLWTQVKIYDFE